VLQGAIATALGSIGPDPMLERRDVDDSQEESSHRRSRLGDLDAYLHCSVIGTCLSTIELRRLMCGLIDVEGASDLFVHHEAVRQVSLDATIARTLSKALDRRHEATLQRFARAADADELSALWRQALQQGDVPGAYWAVLTSRAATPELRQQVYGDVHMLSHLVGASNRADIRRLVALETENADLRERLERQQANSWGSVPARSRTSGGSRHRPWLGRQFAPRKRRATRMSSAASARARSKRPSDCNSNAGSVQNGLPRP